MANETQICITGNLTRDPELRQAGQSQVASFAIASTPRTFDRQTNDWKDGETLFLECSAWRELGQNVAASLKKGTAVIAQGRLSQRSYDDREGNKRTVVELTVDSIGPDLRRATAQVVKNAPQGQGQPSGYQPMATAQPQGGYPQGNYGTVPSYAGGSPTPPYQGQPQGYPPQPVQPQQYDGQTPF